MEGNVVFHEKKSVTGGLITGHAASGANLTGILPRLLYGTREVTVALLTDKGRRHIGMI